MTSLRELFAADGQLAQAIPGYRPRAAQLRMAEAVAEAFDSAGKLVVEAGTGTGKTFAYLVPALLSGRHVLVSTGTRTLQDQLFHRDLPMLAAAMGRPVKVALLKGRANYLCRQRLQESARGRSSPALKKIARWADITTRGDIGELESVPDGDPAWLEATSTRDNCLGQDCPNYKDCFVQQARKNAQQADVVVVNTCGFIDSAKQESLDAIGEALAENGKVIVTGCMGAEPENITAKFPELSLERVKEFQFQVRPYQWIEFRDVALHPKQATHEPRGSLLPEITLAEINTAAKAFLGQGSRVVMVSAPEKPGVAVPDGTPGELEVRGPAVFREYWQRPNETRAAFRDGWLSAAGGGGRRGGATGARKRGCGIS